MRLQNEQLFDVAGRPYGPYYVANLFAAAPERTYSLTNTVSLVVRRNLHLVSDPNPGSPYYPPVYIDFGDGQGYRPATWDQPLGVTYATSGTKRVKIKVNYAGLYWTDTRESWFDLTVLAAPSVNYRGATAPGATTANYVPEVPAAGSADGFDLQIAGTAFTSFRPDYTDHLGATVNVRFALGHTSIIKPFIVVEGYNTAKIAPHLVGNNNRNNTATQFLDNTADPFTSPFNFNSALQQAGYDLVYIDFNDGTDDIRRNAALFEEVVHRVNDMKARAGSTEPNVVMGVSMGGLVARYGLARMVRNGYNP